MLLIKVDLFSGYYSPVTMSYDDARGLLYLSIQYPPNFVVVRTVDLRVDTIPVLTAAPPRTANFSYVLSNVAVCSLYNLLKF